MKAILTFDLPASLFDASGVGELAGDATADILRAVARHVGGMALHPARGPQTIRDKDGRAFGELRFEDESRVIR